MKYHKKDFISTYRTEIMYSEKTKKLKNAHTEFGRRSDDIKVCRLGVTVARLLLTFKLMKTGEIVSGPQHSECCAM